MQKINNLFVVSFFMLASQAMSSNSSVSTNNIHANNIFAFEENKGQITDTEGKLAPYVLFKAESNGMIIWVTKTGITYEFIKRTDNVNKTKQSDYLNSEKKSKQYEWKRVDMILKNAIITAENCVQEKKINLGPSHFYYAHYPKGIKDVYKYSKLTFKNIYKGIDWVVYTNEKNNSLKYDFIVHPNADPNQIKLIYEGNGAFDVKNSQIYFENEIGKVEEAKLYCYQNNQEIISNYSVKKNNTTTNLGAGNFILTEQQIINYKPRTFSYELCIQLNQYDKTKELTIDPQVVWGTFFGGSAHEGGQGITNDPTTGAVTVVGYLGSTNFPVLNGGGFFQGANGGSNDAFIIHFSNTGVHLWSTYVGGTTDEEGICAASDALGNIFVTGYATSANFPTVNLAGAYNQPGISGASDAYILKLNLAGNLLWSTLYGGSGSETGRGICTDMNGNVYLTGGTSSANFPVLNLAGAYNQAAFGGGADNCFIAKFNNNGVQLWSTYFGGSTRDFGMSISADLNNNIFLTGHTMSTNFPLMNPGGGAYYQAAIAGGRGTFISKLNNVGALQWSTFFGGTGSDMLMCVKTDKTGNVFVAGEATSANIPTVNPGNGAYFQGAHGGGTKDLIILKFNNTGTLLWSTYYGGNGDETPMYSDNIAIDSCENIFVSFETTSTNTPTKTSCDATGYNNATMSGTQDQFLTKFTNNGVHLWGTYVGGDGADFGSPITIDKNNNVFMTGEWSDRGTGIINTNTYPINNSGSGAYYNNTFAGGFDDSFIIKFTPPPPVSASATSTNAGCTGNTGSATGNGTNGCAPYQYTWHNSSWTQIGNTQTINNLGAGTYHVIIRDSLSCSIPDTATVTITGGGPPVTFTQNIQICTGSTFTLPDGSTTGTAGTYLDTIALGNGCDSIITTNLAVVNAITISQSATICAGNSYSLPGGGTATTTGTYLDTLTAIGGCDSIITTNLTVNPAVTTNKSDSICAGTSYTLPGGSSVSTAGVYNDTLNTSSGCDSIIVTTLSVVPALTSSQNITICNGNSYTLPGGTVATTAGTYIDTITAQGGCDSIITTSLVVNTNSTFSQSPVICSGNSFTLPSGTIVTSTGTYSDTLLSSNGCDSIITTTLTVNPTPIVTVSPDITIITGNTTTLVATGGGTYNWYPSTGLNTTTGNTVDATPAQTTTYCVEVTDNNGCKDTACVTVTTEIPCPEVANLAVPNAFSPNGDNTNDEFCLQGWTPCNVNFIIYIYNRWGQKVYESKDPNFCWDGSFKGSIMDAQVFVYYIKANYLNETNSIIKEGNISLIK